VNFKFFDRYREGFSFFPNSSIKSPSTSLISTSFDSVRIFSIYSICLSLSLNVSVTGVLKKCNFPDDIYFLSSDS